jgi:succinylglutamic semialdehyde dehydrogenase
MSRGHYIDGEWLQGGGPEFHSTDPATGSPVWTGAEALAGEVNTAVTSARKAFAGWAELEPRKRADHLFAFAVALKENQADLSEIISRETGKPLWESRQEVETMIGKVNNSLEAHKERASGTKFEQAGLMAVTRYRPHGVVAVLGPFNLPGHLPHSHIVPALLAGNTVVYKPSEMTPGVGEKTTEMWRKAGLPAGVLNMVQGGRPTGVALAGHSDLDGLFFTGSYAAGVALNRQFAEHPGKILALEMGGNNPLIVWDSGDAAAAALLIAQSAFITSGQRCTCARRLIVPSGAEGQKYIDAVAALLPRLRVGAWNDKPEPFLGPVISSGAAARLLAAQDFLELSGGKSVVPMRRLDKGPAFLSPGIVDVTEASQRTDEEHFGPLLQVVRVSDFDAALAEANRTRYGLAAGLISDSLDLWEKFQARVRAGIVNRNRQTTGASGKLPFGGVGDSGNHRPSAYFAADYCAYPMASLEADHPPSAAQPPPGIDP